MARLLKSMRWKDRGNGELLSVTRWVVPPGSSARYRTSITSILCIPRVNMSVRHYPLFCFYFGGC